MALTTPATSGFLRCRQVLSLAPGVEGDAVWWADGVIRQVGPAARLGGMIPWGTPVYELREPS